jgi:hypothetical protein
MRKLLTAGLAALTLGGGALATTAPATAAPFHGGGGGWHGGGWHGGGWHGGGFGPGGYLAAGVIGLGLGAALADSYGPYYGPGPYAYGPGPYYGGCYGPERVWDPYVGHYVIEQVRYAC